jgi:hypothetical protein
MIVLYFPSCRLLLRRKILRMLHISKITLIAERKDANRQPVPFSFKAITLQGELVEGTNCIITSSFHAGRTVNVKFLDSGEFRKFRLISFIEFNGQEVCI